MKHILIIGATSAIAEATARLFAQRGDRLYLFGRSQERLYALAGDLMDQGAASVDCGRLDVNHTADHQRLIDQAFESLPRIDIALIAHGTLPNQKACEDDVQACLQELHTNAIGTVSLLTLLANRLERQGSGSIAVITSCAGDRGRQSNYVYGAAKGMVSVFLQGMGNRLHRAGVNVLDIKPGFVDTPMTQHLPKGPLWASPEKIGQGIVSAIEKKKTVAYLPWYWRYIMLAIKLIPESIFRKLKL
ncbi:MAG: SDR family oxidoreductase [Pseudomonadales bacterium]